MGISLEQTILEVRKRNPVFDRLFDDTRILEQYSQSLLNHKFHPVYLKRQKKYKQLMAEWINRIFINDSDPPRINFADTDGFSACTTEHLGVLNYPSLVGGHVLLLLSTLLNRDQYGDKVFLGTALVPLNNPLARRGVEFRGHHVNLFPKRDKHKIVYALPKQEISFIERIDRASISNKFRPAELDFLKSLDRQIREIDYSTCHGYAEQLVKINYYLWPQLFAPEVRSTARRAVIIPHDIILNEYLIKHFFSAADQNNFMWLALFDSDLRKKVLERFTDLYGCWTKDFTKGTHFFWYLHQGEMKSMRLKGEILEAFDHNGTVLDGIPFTPNSICESLQARRIVSGIFVKFGLVNFWLGVKLMGGPGTTQFAQVFKEAWLDILDGEDKELVASTDTSGMTFADTLFDRNEDGDLHKMSGLDACYKHPLNQDYIGKLKNVAVKDAILSALDMNYFRLVPESERQEFNFSLDELVRGFNWIK